MDIATVESKLQCISLFQEVDTLKSGVIRIETVFKYPDGTSIEVFIKPPNLLETRLTDMGQTTAWLLDLQVKPWLSKKRRQLVEDALRTFDVKQIGGELVTDIQDIKQLPDGVIRLSQACLRMADLIFTRRYSLQGGFNEEVEEILSDFELSYESNYEATGRFGKIVPIDFYVRGRQKSSMILTLASANQSAAHTLSNEIFRRWYDLDSSDRREQKVTVFDDRSNAYRQDDLERLSQQSTVVPFADRDGLRMLLDAA